MSRSRSNDDRSGSWSIEPPKKKKKSKKSKKNKKHFLERVKSESRSRSRDRKRSKSRDRKVKKSRSRSPKKSKSKKKRKSRSRSKSRSHRYSDDSNSTSRSRSRSPIAKKRRRRRGRRNRKRKQQYKNDENSEEEGIGAGYGWTAPRGRGSFIPRGRGGFPPRGMGRGRGRGRGHGGPGLRGRGYWKPNYVAYGRNIFPGGGDSSDDSYSSRSRSRSSTSTSRSSTPDNYKNTPDGERRSVTPTPKEKELREKGLMEQLNDKKNENENVTSDRLQTILNQLENPSAYANAPSKGEFVPTFREDMFEQAEAVPLRKELNGVNENVPPPTMPIKTDTNIPTITRPKLFMDYDPVPIPNLDQHLSLRKQMESKENQERLQLEAARIKDEQEKNERIQARLHDIKSEQLPGDMCEDGTGMGILSRRRVSGQMRTATDEPEDKELPPLKPKLDDDDAEFIKSLNNSFKKERGIPELKSDAPMTFAQISSKMTKSRGKVSSTKGLVKGLAPKVLKPKIVLPLWSKPLPDEDSSPTTNVPPVGYTEPVQLQPFSTDILSNAPLNDSNIGPKKPVNRHNLTSRRATTGVVLHNFRGSDTPTPPLPDLTPPASEHQDSHGGPETGTSGSISNAPLTHHPHHMFNGRQNEEDDQASKGGDLENKNNISQNTPPPVIRRSFPPPHIVPPRPNFNAPPNHQLFNGPPPNLPPVMPNMPHSMIPPVVMHTPPTYPNMMPPNAAAAARHPTVSLRREYTIPVRQSIPVRQTNPPPQQFHATNQPQLFHSTRPVLSTSFDHVTTSPPKPADSSHKALDIKQEVKEDKREKINKLFVLYPTIWQGFVSIKKQMAMVQLHHISGNQHIAKSVLPKDVSVPCSDGSNHPALRVTNRVKLDDLTIGQVMKRWKDSSHKCCFMIALPCGVHAADTEIQTASLKSSFMDYFTEKNAAGSLVIKSNSSSWLVYMFPPCPFVETHLSENASDLKRNISDLPKLLIAIIPKEK